MKPVGVLFFRTNGTYRTPKDHLLLHSYSHSMCHSLDDSDHTIHKLCLFDRRIRLGHTTPPTRGRYVSLQNNTHQSLLIWVIWHYRNKNLAGQLPFLQFYLSYSKLFLFVNSTLYTKSQTSPPTTRHFYVRKTLAKRKTLVEEQSLEFNHSVLCQSACQRQSG